jgi:hypothetical protein
MFWGQHELAWQVFYDFCNVVGVPYSDDDRKKLTAWLSIGKSTGWWMAFDGICFCFERPGTLNIDGEGRMHSETDPAMAFRDTYSIYAIHGVQVPEYVILRPNEITVSDIEKEANAEIRRIKIDRYGQSKFLLDAGAKEIHKDDYGTLYIKDVPNDEPLVMVKVVNSTPEPNGEFKDYFLRVDPKCTTARGAVAWSFGKTENEYSPSVQT